MKSTSWHGQLTDNGKYRFDEPIGAGGYGVIYGGIHVLSRKRVAIKISERVDGMSALRNEARIMRHLRNRVPLPKIYDYGKLDSSHNYIVMERLGGPIQPCVNASMTADVEAMYQCRQLLNIIRRIHEMGFVYRDVKPSNYLYAGDGSKKIYAIDFGFVKRYLDDDGAHIPMTARHSPIGTPHYMSVGAHSGHELSRRDDLESLAYLFFYLYRGVLPWGDLSFDSSHEIHEMVCRKRAFRDSDALLNMNNVRKYLMAVDELEFEETPDYARLDHEIAHVVVF